MPKKALFLIIGSFILLPSWWKAQAAVSSCTASADPSSVTPSSTTNFTIAVENTDSVTYQWVKVTRPSDNFTLSSHSVSGWTVSSFDSSQMTLTSGTLNPTNTVSFTIQTIAGGSTASSANWTVQVSDDGGGADSFSCTGSLGTAIESGEAAVTISDIVVSDISDTQAKISWTTDVSASTTVDYGTTDAYGSTATGDAGTSHSVSISSLTANTTYHYNVKSSDVESGDNTFTTAKQGTTTTVTVTGSTRTITATPTPTPIPDTTPPRVTLTTEFAKFYAKAPTIDGKATDPSGVVSLEYSIDGGRNWMGIESDDFGDKTIPFSIVPTGLEDGNYILAFRSRDGKGNRGTTEAGTIVIDRLPPQVGLGIISIGPQVIQPDGSGGITLVAGLEYKITLSAVGGATEISIVGGENGGGTLQKNPDSGLWRGSIRFDAPGMYELTARALDGAGNRTSRRLAQVNVISAGVITDASGTPISDAQVRVFMLDPATHSFSLWDGAPYGQENPQKTGKTGDYRLMLPPGTYYMEVGGGIWRPKVTSLVTLTGVTPITQSFTLTRRFALIFGSFVFVLPDFGQSQETLKLNLPTVSTAAAAAYATEFPFVSFTAGDETITSLTFRGKPTILTFFAPWDPGIATQLMILNELALKKEINVAGIAIHETPYAIATLKARAGYTVPLFSEHDGKTIEPLSLIFSPTHVVIDRRGIIQGMYSGILTKEELLDKLIN